MVGLGTLVNVVAIAFGGAVGTVLGHRLSERTRSLTTDILGLVTGLNAALAAAAVTSPAFRQAVGSSWTFFVVLGALIVGGLIGTALKIELRLEQLGDRLKARFAGGDDQTFAAGFVTASLIFCIGPMAIMGAFNDALGSGIDTLLLKSVLDCFGAIAFGASFGWGVSVSALPVGIYQGALTVLGLLLGSIWDQAQIDAMTAVGGLLLVGISLKLLRLKDIAIGDLLPALFLAPILVGLIRGLN